MAAGNKKKKRPAANPARGFATTSIASKTKDEPPTEAQVPDRTAKQTPVKPAASEINSKGSQTVVKTANRERDLHDLSPEELEAQLEISELQQFVEKHATKVKKEISRQVSRLLTERRLFRSQADYLTVKDWLPDELMLEILNLSLQDYHQDIDLMQRRVLPFDDDLVAKVWQLRQCLLDVEIPLPVVDQALAWLVAHPPAEALVSPAWGFEECFDWISLHCHGDLNEYEFRPIKNVSKAGESSEDGSGLSTSAGASVSSLNLDHSLPSSDIEHDVTNDSVVDVSDVESDLEPEELLEVYLRTKARLYELEMSSRSRSTPQGDLPRTSSTVTKSRNKIKLEQKLQGIERDILFDRREAKIQWDDQRVKLEKAAAERRKLQLVENNEAHDQVSSLTASSDEPRSVNEEAERLGQELLRDAAAMDEDDMLGGMFDSLPGLQNSTPESSSVAPTNVTIRDFGKLTGMNPKRIFEEACKARDSRCKFQYSQVSPTTYACRHSLRIQWSKEQENTIHNFLPDIRISQSANITSFTMAHIATTEFAQSEAYIATAALFFIFSASSKEEKAHLRLPSTYRDLWDEFVQLKQLYILDQTSADVKEVRKLIEGHIHRAEDENEVMFNADSRRRLHGTSGTATPVSFPDIPDSVSKGFSKDLQQMWHRKTATPAYQRMLATRMDLPIFQFRSTALETIQQHQVTILCGETGCGKSTQLPAFILEDELANGRSCNIYCTEPRRISAVSLAQRVNEEMGETKSDLGTSRSLVGYAIRLESRTSSQTRLVYATVGIVLRMLENSSRLDDITHLIIDEVHERSIDTDFLLIVLRSLLLRRPDLKVILMSATVDAQRFAHYLNGAPIIHVPGRTFPVQAKFLEDAIELTGHTNEAARSGIVDDENAEEDVNNERFGGQQLLGYSQLTLSTLESYDEYRIDYSLIVKLIETIACREESKVFSKAILVFLPGIAEIRQVNDMLSGQPQFQSGWRIHPLHSTFSTEDQQAAFQVPPNGVRKIVLATNIAETGITIPDVTCVIDTGKHKEMRFDERRQMSRLTQSFIARANAKQRRGRAGRVQPGLCFHLFTKHRHDHIIAEQQTPEMLRLSLQELVMRVKICKLGNIESTLSDALDPPSTRNVRRAIDALIEVGALTGNEDLTPLGQQLAKLPLDAQLGKLILLGSTHRCLDFALTTAATLSSKSPFLSPMHAKKQADTVRLGFKRGDSDLLTAYNAYTAWRRVCRTPGLSESSFCNKNFLSPQNLGSIEDLKGQLLSALVDAEFVQLGADDQQTLSRMRNNARHRTFIPLPARYTEADDNDELAASVVAWSFYPKLLKKDGKGWRNVANNQSLGLHPISVNKSSLPSTVTYLSFYSIMQSSARFINAQETSAVADFALVLMAGDAVFNMYCGVITIDGNRLRFKVRDWKTMIVLKTLRARIKDITWKIFKNPGRELGDRPRRWQQVLERIFQERRRMIKA